MAQENSMHPFSFDHLNETQFEEFCYDLLGEIGFINTTWRKGTGLSISPSDRGRDIECDRQVTDPVGNSYIEKWFVECKHSQKGVPPERIQGILSWANSERPNHVLIIVSNFLSNPAKDYIKSYETNNNPPFRIHIWERPELEKLTVGKSILRRKYQIGGDFPFIALLHPIHLLYFRSPPINSLSYFFDVLDRVEPGKRDEAMSLTYFRIINPGLHKSITGKEKIGELLADEVSYEAFRRRCQKIVEVIAQDLFVFLLVNHTLRHLFALGDLTNVDTIVQRHQSDIAYFRNLLKGFESDIPEDRKELSYFVDSAKSRDLPFHEENLREDIEAIIKNLTQSLSGVESRTRSSHSLYEYFCENVVGELLKEEMHLNLSR